MVLEAEPATACSGNFYLGPDTPSFDDLLDTVDMPLNQLSEAQLCPSHEVLRKLKTKFE